ncbi:MAG: hypothetical protein WC477_06195 [Patescibacteria group bacterium]
MIMFTTMCPTANNSERSKTGREQHATPSWNRLTSGDKQSGKMRGENNTKEARRVDYVIMSRDIGEMLDDWGD